MKAIVHAFSVLAVMASLAALSLAGCGGQGKTKLKVFNADSLMVPFAAIEKAFEARYPDVDVLIEGHGSIQVIRYVTELHAEVDVAAVADYSLLPMMMYGAQLPDGAGSYADWCIKFATNRLGIAYTASSKHAEEIDTSNWFEVLSRSDVRVGLSDPRFDSSGYRALMMCQLAEAYYGNDAIFENLLGNDFSPPITVSQERGEATVVVPEVLRPGRISLRGSSIALLSTIESGDIDYAFMYESVAKQHGLRFLPLPAEIDLSSAEYADLYATVRCKLAFQRFASVEPEFVGEPIVYGITVPRNAPYPELAAEFIEFLLSPEGQTILSHTYQPPLVPSTADFPGNVPEGLRPFVE